VPLRRVNQKYVIATSTKVSVAGVDVSKVGDALFKRDVAAEKKAAVEVTTVSTERAALQKSVDAALIKNIGGTEKLEAYLRARFTLSNSDKPHLLKF
jgi:large subunit ribosomal protein L6e